MEYLQQILKATPRDFAGSLNAEIQMLCQRYGGKTADLDVREDPFDHMVHCNWRINGKCSPSVRFEWDLQVNTFCNAPKTYNLIDPQQYEQLLYDVMDSLVPTWG
jgi:hypothetical protein